MSSVRWGFLWQRHHAFAAAAANDGWTVDFLEPLIRGPRHLAAGAVAQFRGHAGARIENPVPPGVSVVRAPRWLGLLPPSLRYRELRRLIGQRYDVAILYVPDAPLVALAEHAADHPIYDHVLDWSRVPASWGPPRRFRRSEATMQQAPWRCMTDGEAPRDRGFRDHLVVSPAADEPFALHRWQRPPDDGSVLYFGSVQPGILDTDLLVEIARNGLRVRIVGPIGHQATRERLVSAGAECLGTLPPHELPAAVEDAAALILPYAIDTGREVIPAKLWNCLATNRPVLYRGITPPGAARDLMVELPADTNVAIRVVRETVQARHERTPHLETWDDRWGCVLAELIGDVREGEPDH